MQPADTMGRMPILMHILAVAFLFLQCATGQEVTVANHWNTPFAGWVRTTVDTRPPHASGVLPDGTRYVLGRQTGRNVWAVDLHLEMDTSEVRTVDLGTSSPAPAQPVPLPADILAHFGGWVAVNGQPLLVVGYGIDGNQVAVHCRGRVGRTFVVNVWLEWRPEEPWLVRGEANITSSNPAVPDVLETVPFGGYSITFGDGGWDFDQTGTPTRNAIVLAPSGDTFADGQGRSIPLCWAWPRNTPSIEAWFLTVPQALKRTTCAVGVRELWAGQGNPRLPANTDPVAWTGTRYPTALARMLTWGSAATGPNMNSADSGAQGDQVFVDGECKLAPGPEQVTYLSALKLAARPNHLVRPDGSPMDPDEVTNVQFWHGRPHQQSTHNLLGKSRGIDLNDTRGWWGPDTEHWLANGLTVAARVTGSRALQWELEQQARLFLMSQVLPGPGKEHWVTAGTDAARAIGWVCILAVHLWENLEDRALAERVRARVVARILQVYVPQLGARGDYWDVRRDDPRLGAGDWWICWQQAVGAYGLDLASERFGVPEGRAVALRGAQAVLRDAWRQVAGRWQSQPQRPTDTSRDTGRDESFNYFGMSMAVATVLKHDTANAQARSIWQQLEASATKAGDWSWLAPELSLPSNPPVPTATSVSQWGITWTFDRAVPVGQFCNGDWWAVGPVTIVGISPGRQTQPDGRVTGGSMLNPMPLASGRQGYDSQLFAPYLGDETGAPRWRPEMSLVVPATIATGSIVSTAPFFGTHPEQVSVLRTAAVLTVLSQVPPAGAFRPPYAGTDKSIPATEADIDWTALASLQPAPGMPEPVSIANKFDGSLWLDHFPSWTSRYMHPVDGLPDYYRGFTTQIGNAALAVNCATTPATIRKSLTVALCQMGIDNHRHMELGAVWGVNGHCNGRKFPILFAGRVLGLPQLLAAGVTYAPTVTVPGGPGKVFFSEDGQTYYLPDGTPEWANFYLADGRQDTSWTGNSYRRCCSANGWVGCVLAMRAMGLQDAWSQPAFFDYMDRYQQTEVEWRAWEPWQGRMWDMHRGAL